MQIYIEVGISSKTFFHYILINAMSEIFGERIFNIHCNTTISDIL